MPEKTMDKETEEAVQEIMYEIVFLLNSYGIAEVRAGAVMRLLGTPDQEALMFDDKVLVTNNGAIELRELDQIPDIYPEDVDPDRTLH